MKGLAATNGNAEQARMPIQAKAPEAGVRASGSKTPLQQMADASVHVAQLRRLGGVMNRAPGGGPGSVAVQRQLALSGAPGIVQKVDASEAPKLKLAHQKATEKGEFNQDTYYQALNFLKYPLEDDWCERGPDEAPPEDVKGDDKNEQEPMVFKLANSAPVQQRKTAYQTRPAATFVVQARMATGLNTAMPIQLARNPFSISGPKSYTASDGTALNNVVYQTDAQGNIDFANPSQFFIGNAYPGYDPVTAGSQVDVTTAVNNHGTGNRYQHFKDANSQAPGFGGQGGNSPSNLTWHHLSSRYDMHLVDRNVHAKHGHNGGVHIW